MCETNGRCAAAASLRSHPSRAPPLLISEPSVSAPWTPSARVERAHTECEGSPIDLDFTQAAQINSDTLSYTRLPRRSRGLLNVRLCSCQRSFLQRPRHGLSSRLLLLLRACLHSTSRRLESSQLCNVSGGHLRDQGSRFVASLLSKALSFLLCLQQLRFVSFQHLRSRLAAIAVVIGAGHHAVAGNATGEGELAAVGLEKCAPRATD